MTQDELNAAVAASTGESLETIRHRGFSRADPIHPNYDPEPWDRDEPVDIESKCLDWDELERIRFSRCDPATLSA